MTLPPSRFTLFFLAATLLISLFQARAQARPVADKLSDVSVFLSGSLVNTDYSGSKQPGISGGADYTFALRRLQLGAAFEGRASYTPVFSYVGLRVLSGGFRFESTHFRRYRPYANILVGAGKIYYDFPPQAYDRSVVVSFGGGVDLDMARRFSARLELEDSRWRPDPAVIRYPSMVNLGLVYHIPICRGFAR